MGSATSRKKEVDIIYRKESLTLQRKIERKKEESPMSGERERRYLRKLSGRVNVSERRSS